MRSLALMACVTALTALGGCAYPEQTCAEARVGATTAWKAYIQSMEDATAQTKKLQSKTQTTMEHEIRPRLSKQAEAYADARYPRGADAWQRAFTASYEASCGQDAQCKEIKNRGSLAQASVAHLTTQLSGARIALDLVGSDPERARQAVAGVEDHAANPLMQSAVDASTLAFEKCVNAP